MSLINQMLRDLDARRASAADRAQLQDIVHAAPQSPRGNWAAMVLGILAVAAAAGGVWYWLLGGTPRAAAPAPMVQAPPAPVVPPPAQPAATVAAAPIPEQPAAPPPVVPAQAVAAAAAKPAAAPQAAKPPVSAKSVVPTAVAAAPLPTAPAAAPAAKAVPAADTSIEKRPHTPLANEAAENEYNKALAALRRGATADAVAGFQSALRLDPLHASARQALLSVLLRQQQLGDAQAVAEAGLAVDASQTGWAIIVARLQMENGKLAEAAETLTAHARYAERNADYQAFLALLLQKQKRFREAGERYIAAVTLRPGEARWWYGLGIVLEADQRPQEAREAFTKARDAGNLPPELAAALKHHLR
jgi:MSHA biogenesis protein MshN